MTDDDRDDEDEDVLQVAALDVPLHTGERHVRRADRCGEERASRACDSRPRRSQLSSPGVPASSTCATRSTAHPDAGPATIRSRRKAS